MQISNPGCAMLSHILTAGTAAPSINCASMSRTPSRGASANTPLKVKIRLGGESWETSTSTQSRSSARKRKPMYNDEDSIGTEDEEEEFEPTRRKIKTPSSTRKRAASPPQEQKEIVPKKVKTPKASKQLDTLEDLFDALSSYDAVLHYF